MGFAAWGITVCDLPADAPMSDGALTAALTEEVLFVCGTSTETDGVTALLTAGQKSAAKDCTVVLELAVDITECTLATLVSRPTDAVPCVTEIGSYAACRDVDGRGAVVL